MLVSKKEYNKLKKQKDEIITALEEEIGKQEKRLNKSSKKLNKLVDKIARLKTGIDSVSSLIEYDSNDVVIANITNFLIEQGNEEASKIISKCRIYKVSIIRLERGLYANYGLSINLHCPGDAYKILNDEDNPVRTIIIDSFRAYYSYTHMCEIFIQNGRKGITSLIRKNYPDISIELSMRRINPKESDIEKFFEKVEELKKQLKAE